MSSQAPACGAACMHGLFRVGIGSSMVQLFSTQLHPAAAAATARQLRPLAPCLQCVVLISTICVGSSSCACIMHSSVYLVTLRDGCVQICQCNLGGKSIRVTVYAGSCVCVQQTVLGASTMILLFVQGPSLSLCEHVIGSVRDTAEPNRVESETCNVTYARSLQKEYHVVPEEVGETAVGHDIVKITPTPHICVLLTGHQRLLNHD